MSTHPKPEKRGTKPVKRIRTRRPLGTVRKEAKAAGNLTQDEWAAICQFYEVDGWTRCAYGEGERATQQDHVVPIAKGGLHTASNVVPACERHNTEKGQLVWEPKRRHPYMVGA